MIRKQECNLGNFITDAFRSVLDCDVAISNGGGILYEIEPGVIAYNNLMKALPYLHIA